MLGHATMGLLVTGAADGALTVWRDATAEHQADRAQQAAHEVAQQQHLSNALQVRLQCIFWALDFAVPETCLMMAALSAP